MVLRRSEKLVFQQKTVTPTKSVGNKDGRLGSPVFIVSVYNIIKQPLNEVKGDNMLTIKIYLKESGQVADMKKDFPVYQGQFNNILLNVFVPTSLLAPYFQEIADGSVVSPYVAGTAVKIAMRTIERNGSYKMSNDHYMRYIKTLAKDGVSYALLSAKCRKSSRIMRGKV